MADGAPTAVGGRRVLLFSVNQYDFPYPVFPLGAAHVEAALRAAGYITRLIDCNLNRRPVADLVADFAPDFVGISVRNIDDALIRKRETFFEDVVALCRELRHHTPAPLILGGSGFSIFPEILLEASGADYGIVGEGEAQLVSLLAALEAAQGLGAVSGLVHRRGAQVVVNSRTDHVPPGLIAMADRAEPMALHYLRTSSMLNVQTQRGCALRCCYCTYPLLEGRTYRRRPPELVAEEFERLQAQGARYLFVVDSVFNTALSHVMGICEAVIRRGLTLKWCCFLRPQHLTREQMEAMARAGLAHVEFGSDSLSDPVLKEYGKGLTFEDVLESNDLARAAGVDAAHFLILGGPGETWETLEETIAHSRQLSGTTLMARVGMRVYPGTPLHERLLREPGAGPLPDLLQPYYHVAPAVTEAGIFARLRELPVGMSNWVFEDPPPSYYSMAERLRARGVVGPLWSYFSMLQRLGGLTADSGGMAQNRPDRPEAGRTREQ